MFTVTLSCNHEATFSNSPPLTNDMVYCAICANYFTVIEAPYEYRIKCRPCGFFRQSEFSHARAFGKATTHATKYPTHIVYVMLGNTVVDTFEPTEKTYLHPALIKIAERYGITVPVSQREIFQQIP